MCQINQTRNITLKSIWTSDINTQNENKRTIVLSKMHGTNTKIEKQPVQETGTKQTPRFEDTRAERALVAGMIRRGHAKDFSSQEGFVFFLFFFFGFGGYSNFSRQP